MLVAGFFYHLTKSGQLFPPPFSLYAKIFIAHASGNQAAKRISQSAKLFL